jgi:predicted CopG family antitoxin
MLQKVSDSDKMKWLDSGESVKRESVNKSALDSFSEVVVKRAKTLKSKGESIENIAKSMNLTKDVLNGMIEASHNKEAERPTCDCMNKEAAAEETNDSAAQEAYEQLYGRKQETTVSDVIRNTIVPGKTADTGG